MNSEWHKLEDAEAKPFIRHAQFLIDKGYMLNVGTDVDELAKQIWLARRKKVSKKQRLGV